jgi:hypothetical protein
MQVTTVKTSTAAHNHTFFVMLILPFHKVMTILGLCFESRHSGKPPEWRFTTPVEILSSIQKITANKKKT